MPFKSMQQSKWMFANKPEIAKEMAAKTDYKKLPKKAGMKMMKKSKWEGVK